MNLLGIIGAILILIILIYKRIPLIAASLLCLLILAVTNGISFTELAFVQYAQSLGEFIRKYFLVFVSNALFGQIMEDTLLASAFSRMTGKWFGQKNAVYGALLATALLSYGGISAFVIVFTVYPIFLSAFKEADLPRKLIPACIMSSSCTYPLSMLPGSAQLNNIIPIKYIGTTPTAAPVIGLISGAAAAAFAFLYFRYEFASARRKGEHFDETNEIRLRLQKFQKDPGIPGWLASLPMVLVLLLVNIFSMDLSYAVFAGCFAALIIGWKNLDDKRAVLTSACNLIGPATIVTAASVGFGGALLACPGSSQLLEKIAALPVPPVISLCLACAFAGVLTGNGGGASDVAMRLLSPVYLQMGIAAPILHRVSAIATAGFSCLPHNGMLITIMNTSGFSAKQCYKYIFISTVLCSGVGLIVAVALSLI